MAKVNIKLRKRLDEDVKVISTASYQVEKIDDNTSNLIITIPIESKPYSQDASEFEFRTVTTETIFNANRGVKGEAYIEPISKKMGDGDAAYEDTSGVKFTIVLLGGDGTKKPKDGG